MSRLIVIMTVALLLAPVLSIALGDRARDLIDGTPAVRVPDAISDSGTAPGTVAVSAPAPPPAYRQPSEDSLFQEAAATAWRYVASQTNETTGWSNSVARYSYATVWDLASCLAAIYSAHRLGIIDLAEYDTRMGRALRSFVWLPLFDGAAFNKNYHVARGSPAGRNDREVAPRPDGFGWSAMDMGRLLVWLKIIERTDSTHAAQARAIVARLDLDRLVDGGYLQGAVLSRGEVRSYQEGRIGYEQYAAAGFALWGVRAQRALDWSNSVVESDVLGVPVLTDRRAGAHLTSEPFLLMGIELGWWDSGWRAQADRMLQAQEARYDQTGQLTMVSEDALPVAPSYFYYYTVSAEGEPFAVKALGAVPDPAPRWVSSKAAFAWYALNPGPYTWEVLQAIAEGAQIPGEGWGSGIYEVSGSPTGSPNINTAAVILESALYHSQRRPLVTGGLASAPPAPIPN